MGQVIVNAGADLNGKVGDNILLSSASTGKIDILKFALTHGVDVVGGGGEAALGAAKASCWEAVLELVVAGSDLVSDGVGVQLLALAAVQEQQEVVELLENRGVAVQSEAGMRALARLATPSEWDRCYDAVKYLVDKGVNLKSEAGHGALVTAARYGDLDMVQCLAAEVDMKSEAAGEALAWAGELGTTEGKIAVVSYLTGLGAIAPAPPKLV